LGALYRLPPDDHRLIPGSSKRFATGIKGQSTYFSLGRWIFISTAVTFLGMQADRLILGKLISFEAVGIYGIALALSEMPRGVDLGRSR